MRACQQQHHHHRGLELWQATPRLALPRRELAGAAAGQQQCCAGAATACRVPCRGANAGAKRVHHKTTRPHAQAHALFDPPPFSPDKLSVSYRVAGQQGAQQAPRRYTLTHNDLTGALHLTVDTEYNYGQISGFYTRLLRDEVTAEWQFGPPSGPSLHLYCHVSGSEPWLAPPALRNYIFRREIPLVRGGAGLAAASARMPGVRGRERACACTTHARPHCLTRCRRWHAGAGHVPVRGPAAAGAAAGAGQCAGVRALQVER